MLPGILPRAIRAAVLGLAMTLLLACGSPGTGSPAAWDPCADPGDEPFARLHTGGGFAGVDDTITVRCDGTVERNGEVTARDTATVATLIQQLRDSGVLALGDQTFRPDGQCNDCFNYRLELAEGSAIRRWSAEESAMPEQLGAAINAMLEADQERP